MTEDDVNGLKTMCGALFFGESILLGQHNNTLVQAIACPTALRAHVFVCGLQSLYIPRHSLCHASRVASPSGLE